MIPSELTQKAYFGIDDVRACGVSHRELRTALRNHDLVRLKRGWFTGLLGPAHSESDRHRLRLEVELLDHPMTVPSHWSAALRLGLPVHRPDWTKVHLMRTAPGSPQSRGAVVIHQQVEGADRFQAALALAQTALQCPVSGLMALDAALARQLVTLAEVRTWAGRLVHHAGHAHLRPVLRLADPRRESPLESRTALVCAGLGFELESQFHVPDTPFRADARIRGSRVLIETDGATKYTEAAILRKEKEREDAIRSLGWEVVRATSQVLDDPRLLQVRIQEALARAQLKRRSAA